MKHSGLTESVFRLKPLDSSFPDVCGWYYQNKRCTSSNGKWNNNVIGNVPGTSTSTNLYFGKYENIPPKYENVPPKKENVPLKV